MTLAEAERSNERFNEQHGQRLRAMVHAAMVRRGTAPKLLVVGRSTFEAVVREFGHWVMESDEGRVVANIRFSDSRCPYENILFKGVPMTYFGAGKIR